MKENKKFINGLDDHPAVRAWVQFIDDYQAQASLSYDEARANAQASLREAGFKTGDD
jgi:hypothetical protein